MKALRVGLKERKKTCVPSYIKISTNTLGKMRKAKARTHPHTQTMAEAANPTNGHASEALFSHIGV